MRKDLSLTEQLCYNTTRIVSLQNNGSTFYATGFFVGVDCFDNKVSVLLITNYHVIRDSKEIKICLTIQDDEGNPVDTEMMEVTIRDLKNKTISHPEEDLDLSAIFVTSDISETSKKCGKNPYYRNIPLSMIATREDMNKLDAMEDIIMIGYPEGMWDSTNNRPIFRRGITATDPKVDFNGKRKFLIDCACIWGSSGSPVIVTQKTITTKKIKLIGIQHAMPTKKITGQLEVVDLPTENKKGVVPTSEIPINIGYIIKAECIFDIIRETERRYPDVKFNLPT